MSNATVLDKPVVANERGQQPATLIVVYGKNGPDDATTVKLRVTTLQAAQMIDFWKNALCSTALTSGVDLNGKPYGLDLGTDKVVALYVEG